MQTITRFRSPFVLVFTTFLSTGFILAQINTPPTPEATPAAALDNPDAKTLPPSKDTKIGKLNDDLKKRKDELNAANDPAVKEKLLRKVQALENAISNSNPVVVPVGSVTYPADFGLSTLEAQSPTSATGPSVSIPTGSLLWQIGIPDDRFTEFGDFHRGSETVEITSVGTVIGAAGCAKISRGVCAALNPAFDVHYPLTEAPKNGAFFSFKLLQAPRSSAQMAVYSNGSFAGLIQLWGTAGTDYPHPWMKTYRLYIPREFLKAGQNELRFTAPPVYWGNHSNDKEQWWEWDYLKLEALNGPITEPWHGKISYLGTNLSLGHTYGWSRVDDNTLRFAPVALKWLGIAYSGNTIRASYWYRSEQKQPKRLEYLQLLASYNMTVMADYFSAQTFNNDPDGRIPQKWKGGLKTFLQNYGKYIQYYELGNEPCMTGSGASGGLAEYLTLAREFNADKPAYMRTVAPGWAYGGGIGGPPHNWDAVADYRREVENLCDCINGHAYCYSYAENLGGSFLAEMADVGKIEDGWPKEFLNSETGTHRFDSENTFSSAHQASTQPHIQVFDRILRAHLAVVDHTMQHAAIWSTNTAGTAFGLFMEPKSWDGMDLDGLTENTPPDGPGNDSRLKVYRRLALAYATHGSPLPYTVLNRSDLTYKMVYFRAVDTSTLPPQPGSGATSNKILLNFVNFENAPETLDVKVVLPAKGTYHAERVGRGDTWGAAHSDTTLTGTPDVELKEALGPGESVQYILSLD